MPSLKLIIVLALTSAATAVLAQDKPLNFVICRSKKIVRTVRAEFNPASGCKAIYAKAGKDREIASGQWQGTCQKVVSNVKRNLEASGWQCRAVDKFTITKATEE